KGITTEAQRQSPPPRHCERSEAIQRSLDCFVAALLAMTGTRGGASGTPPLCPLCLCGDISLEGRGASLGGLGGRQFLEDGQHFLGEQLEAALRDRIRRAAEAERDVELEVANHLPARLEVAQDLVGRAPARGFHEAGDRALGAALAHDLGLLL